MVSRIKKFTAGFFAILIILISLILAVRVVWNFIEGRKISAAREKAGERKIPVRYKDLIPDCPETANASGFLNAASSLLAREDIRPYRDALHVLFEGRFPEGEAGIPLANPPNKYRLAIELLEEASRQTCFRPFYRDTPFSQRNYSGLAAQKAMRIFAVETARQAEQGQVAAALDRCRIGFRLSRMLLDEPTLISGLLAISNLRSWTATLYFVLQSRTIPAEQMSEWIENLDPLAFRTQFAWVIKGERAGLLESGEILLEGGSESIRPNMFWTWLARPLIKAQTRSLLAYYDDLEKIADEPYFAQLSFHDEYTRRIENKPGIFRLFKNAIPNYQSAFFKEAVLESIFLTIRTGLACRIYKARNGTYPENLEALVPEILPEVPIDPFTGNPLVYRLENGLPLIYSLGSNQKDDGGRSTYDLYSLVASRDDDWTWRETVRP